METPNTLIEAAAQEAQCLKDLLVSRLVVPSPEGLASQPGHIYDFRDARLRAAALDVRRAISYFLRRGAMGKLYGIHDSYCGMLRSFGKGVCTCEAGRATDGTIEMDRSGVRILKSKFVIDAERMARAQDYAKDTIDRFMKSGITTSPGQLAKAHELFVQKWLDAHPEEPAPAPPAGEDGPGEEDGPWAPGYAERTGDGVAPISTTHPVTRGPGVKVDTGKPQPFTFFIRQFPMAVVEVAQIMEEGCEDPGHVFLGWRTVPNGFERYTEAMVRHLITEADPLVTHEQMEKGMDRGIVALHQAATVAANAFIRLELLLRERARNLNLDAERAP